jgi:hypothetical protein
MICSAGRQNIRTAELMSRRSRTPCLLKRRTFDPMEQLVERASAMTDLKARSCLLAARDSSGPAIPLSFGFLP